MIPRSKFVWMTNAIVVCLIGGLILFVQVLRVLADHPAGYPAGYPVDIPAQIPTGAIPTVTGTPVGALVVVIDSEQGFANVRSGPGTVGYEIVGVLVVGSQTPGLGRSPGGDWVQIAYPGVPGGVAWIWAPLVDVSGKLPIVEPPPTPTPRVTATIDPTLAAQFLVDIPPTRLPTFTPPAPIPMSTFPADAPLVSPSRVPMGLIIIGMAVVGIFGLGISFLRGR